MRHDTRPSRNTGPNRNGTSRCGLWLTVALTCGMLGSAESSSASPTAAPQKASPYVAGLPSSARQFYALTWGVDQLSVKLAQSSQLVLFNYRVVDAEKAKALNEVASTPYLFDEEVRAVLRVPEMEKVGKLRQAGAPENGRTYWMVFSNKGNFVKPGHRVSVMIGQVRVDGLVVQ